VANPEALQRYTIPACFPVSQCWWLPCGTIMFVLQKAKSNNLLVAPPVTLRQQGCLARATLYADAGVFLASGLRVVKLLSQAAMPRSQGPYRPSRAGVPAPSPRPHFHCPRPAFRALFRHTSEAIKCCAQRFTNGGSVSTLRAAALKVRFFQYATNAARRLGSLDRTLLCR
jgi:hypothetical protein